MTNPANIALIGLGSMGYGMARCCLKAGLTTYGFDVVPAQMEKFQAEGGASGALGDVAPTFDVVVVVVLNAAQTEEVMFGDQGVVPMMKKGAVLMACATVPTEFAKAMEARCADVGVHYLDAPISGGSLKAASGHLSIMAAGAPEAMAAARPVLDATSETVFELGDKAGAGSAMKAVNQLLAGVHLAAMAEAITALKMDVLPMDEGLF